MNPTLKTLQILSALCLVAGLVIAYSTYLFGLNWFGVLGNENAQMLIGNIVIFIGLLLRGYYRYKKYGSWFYS